LKLIACFAPTPEYVEPRYVWEFFEKDASYGERAFSKHD